MIILAIDTATTTAGVAVSNGPLLLAETSIVRKETHSKHLMGMIDYTLQLAGVQIDQIEGVAYCEGPGSFTGLRIGLSVVKGLAFVGNKPVVGISSLEALAAQTIKDSRLICTLLDARNKEVYAARYRWQDDRLVCVVTPQSMGPREFLETVTEPCIFVGDGALRYQGMIEKRIGKNATFASPFHNVIHASTIARLSASHFSEGEVGDIQTATPHYIRKSYAEARKIDA